MPTFSPHALRHRRISLLHRQGVSWATIGERMGQRSKLVTADIYTHALIETREVDRAKLLERVSDVRGVQTPVQTPEDELAAFAGKFGATRAHAWNPCFSAVATTGAQSTRRAEWQESHRDRISGRHLRGRSSGRITDPPSRWASFRAAV